MIAPKRNPKKKKGKPQKVELAFAGGEEKPAIANPKYVQKNQYEERKKPEPSYDYQDQAEEETAKSSKYQKKKHDKDKKAQQDEIKEQESKKSAQILSQKLGFIDDHISNPDIIKLLQNNLEPPSAIIQTSDEQTINAQIII